MSRFNGNRSWAFILALSIAFASSLTLSRGAAGEEPPPTQDQPPGGDIGGDPDRPMAPKGTARRGQPSGGGMGIQQTTVGDGVVDARVWMWRLRVAAQSLRSFYFRY